MPSAHREAFHSSSKSHSEVTEKYRVATYPWDGCAAQAHVLLSLFVLVVASVMLWVALVRLREPRMSRAAK